MYVCQWHLEVPFGKQGEVVRILRAWGEEKRASSAFRKAVSTRLMVGHVGESPSHVIDEYVFESLADFEAALAGMTEPQFRPHADALAPYVVAASQRWVVHRVLG